MLSISSSFFVVLQLFDGFFNFVYGWGWHCFIILFTDVVVIFCLLFRSRAIKMFVEVLLSSVDHFLLVRQEASVNASTREALSFL